MFHSAKPTNKNIYSYLIIYQNLILWLLIPFFRAICSCKIKQGCRACSLIWWFQCIYFCCSYLWILRKCLFKIPMLHLIMLLQIGNLHHRYSLLVYQAHGSCVGWRENECTFFSPFFFELPIFTVHLSFSSELGTHHFCAISMSDDMETSPITCADPTKTHGEGTIVRGPQSLSIVDACDYMLVLTSSWKLWKASAYKGCVK